MGDGNSNALPHLSMIQMTQGFNSFSTKISPVVAAWEYMYGLMTIKNSRDTLTFLFTVSYAIIYQETMVKMIPFIPILIILFIFYNYFYEIEFKRPKMTLLKNFKFL